MKKIKQILAIAMVVMTAVVFTPMVPGVGSAAYADDGQQAVQAQQVQTCDINKAETEELATQGIGTSILIKVAITGFYKSIEALVNFLNYESNLQTLEGGNYVIDKDTTIDHGFLIKEKASVILVIKDGCTLTINNTTQNDPGICVPKKSNLTITGGCDPDKDYKGTGKLVVKGSGGGAAIGGTSDEKGDRTKDCGSITIEGANIEATGGGRNELDARDSGGAGIGGGCGGAGMDITINGGNVKAIGGYKAAGIGSGDDGGRGDRGGKDIIINGGTVYAEGGIYSAGIGGGYGSDGCDITVNGGTVTAKAGTSAAGIGGGKAHTANDAHGYDININGGTVNAYGGARETNFDDFSGAAIGSGYNRAGYDIYLNGGNINCYPQDGSPGVGGGRDGETYDIQMNGGNLWVKGYAAIGSLGDNKKPKTKDININGGSIKLHVPYDANYLAYAVCVGTLRGNVENIKITGGNLSMESEYSSPKSTLVGTGMSDGSAKNIKVSTALTIYKNYNTGEKMSNSGGDLGTSFKQLSYARIVNEGSVSFMTASGSMKTVSATKVPSNCTGAETASEDSISTQANETIELSDKFSNGYYYVEGDTLVENSLRCDGNIKLILKDGSKLTANGCKNKAGIEVGKNDRLTIYGGEDGDGAIEATGGSKAAGIGSDYKKACGKINIIGGIISAKAGTKASAIGAGYKGKSGGSVRVNTILKLLAKKGKWSTIKNKGGNLIKLIKSRGYVEIKTVDENL